MTRLVYHYFFPSLLHVENTSGYICIDRAKYIEVYFVGLFASSKLACITTWGSVNSIHTALCIWINVWPIMDNRPKIPVLQLYYRSRRLSSLVTSPVTQRCCYSSNFFITQIIIFFFFKLLSHYKLLSIQFNMIQKLGYTTKVLSNMTSWFPVDFI